LTRRNPPRDAALGRLLRDVEGAQPLSGGRDAALRGRILAAAAPLLDERAAPNRTVWDYTERWAAALLPIGALTAVAAGLCLFALSSGNDAPRQAVPGVRLALLGAATNRVSSQNLVDFLVASDAAVTAPNRGGR
jgi:hypothetical protein